MKRTCPKIHHLLFAYDSIFFIKADESNARTLKTTLKRYSEVKGQKINLEKSCIQFGNSGGDEHIVNETLEMVENAGKYLGLPTSWGRSKRNALWYIKERIIKKHHGWKSIFFNNSGKEVFINVVITAIPTYFMTLCRLPKTLYDDISKLIAMFWWNGRDERKKIHLVRWGKLTLPKDMSGMIFLGMVDFNTKMLTKSAWRLQNAKYTIWARVM